MKQDAGECRRQNLGAPRLPDFCNMGAWLRILLAVNAGMLALAFDASGSLDGLVRAMVERAALVEPITLGCLIALCAAQRVLARFSATSAAVIVMAMTTAVAGAFALVFTPLLGGELSLRPVLWAGMVTLLLLAAFDLAARAREPALAEARLLALTARIRPHFLFNSLNAVLGVIRSDPRRAEAALEELADLFRALMRDNRDLVPLSDEIALSRQYLELERLRLGERLQVRWEIESCPPDTLVPPLMLQPLLENAVYHGIEPATGSGEIVIRIARNNKEIRIEIANPAIAEVSNHAGNQMALANIRERLMLFFDLEGQMSSEQREGRYTVSISFPYRQRTP